jgi:hypothetical protein
LKRLEKAANFCPACGGKDGVHLIRDPQVIIQNICRADAKGVFIDFDKLTLTELEIIAGDDPGDDFDAR